MSYILRSSSYIKALKRSAVDQGVKPQSIENHEFFYDSDICASITADWTDPVSSLGRLAQLGGVEGIAKSLRTDLKQGLLSDEVDEGDFSRRVAVYGANTFKKKKMRGFFLLCLDELKDKVLLVLITAGLISTIYGAITEREHHGYIDGLAILCTVAVVVLVAAGNNYRKEKQFRSLDDKKDIKKVVVLRGGIEMEILNTQVLVGDIAILCTGVSIPADGVLISGTEDLMCEESGLTGESKAIRKSTKHPFMLAGTQVVSGEGIMLVSAVGCRTCWGAILEGLSEKRPQTPLEKKLTRLVKLIGYCGTAVAVVMFLCKFSYLMYDYFILAENLREPKKLVLEMIKNFVVSVTLIVVAIPEGLPLAVTITLAYSMKKMYKDNNFVRVLSACETMGNATTICSDKTGTITQNKMTIVEVWPDIFVKEKGVPSPVFGEEMPSLGYKNALFESIALNSKVFMIEQEKWANPKDPEFGGGNKTEIALHAWGKLLCFDENMIRKSFPVEKAYPFSSATKHSSVLVKHIKGVCRLYLKGAAEKVVQDFCTYIMSPQGEVTPLTEVDKKAINVTIDSLVGKGLRCIGLAYRDYDHIEYKDGDSGVIDPAFCDFVFLAVTAVKDPVREDVREAMITCQRAGIVVRMVTGDHPKTAEFIADDCGIRAKDRRDLIVMTGDQFRVMSDQELEKVLPKLRVLARSTPQDKEKLVRWYMSHNETVAVTGDGANDALALKEAHVGLAMGIQGTDVAKEAADIIILDDSFASIVETVKWGRSVYDNICKFIQFQLTINIVALVASFLGVLVNLSSKVSNFPLPFTPVQLLWINIIMDTGAALAYSTEEPSMDLLKRKPYRKDSMLISYSMWKCIIGQAILQLILVLTFVLPVSKPIGFALFQISETNKNNYKELTTCVFNTFVWLQIFNSLNARKIRDELNIFENIYKNIWFPAIFGVIIGFQILIVSFADKIANVVRISLTQWLICIAFGFISFPLGFLLRIIPIKRNYGFIETEDDIDIAINGKKSQSRRAVV